MQNADRRITRAILRTIDRVRSRLPLLGALLFAALPAFAHGSLIVLYVPMAAGIIAPVIFIIRAAWFNGRGTILVLATSALIVFGLAQIDMRNGCINFFLFVLGPSIVTLLVSAVAYQFDSLRK